jgi:hypothetical protein
VPVWLWRVWARWAWDLCLYLLCPRPDRMGADPERENGMFRIEGGQCNPRMVWVEKITAGPVGNGTQFRSPVASMGRTAEVQDALALVRITEGRWRERDEVQERVAPRPAGDLR